MVKLANKNWNKIGHLIDEIKEGLHQLRSWRIEYIRRDANYATHSLAREAIVDVWVEEIPNCVYGIVSRSLMPLLD
jgi:hypothetical protein